MTTIPATDQYLHRLVSDPAFRAETLARFEKFVFPEPNTGCWLWGSELSHAGYGRFNFRRTPVLASRVAHTLYCSPIPAGMWVCHKCDTPACVNPDHLFLGTSADNVRDMVAKGRHWQKTRPDAFRAMVKTVRAREKARGHINSNAKLTPEQARSIRQSSNTTAALMAQYGLSRSAICNVRNGKTWSHV